MPQAFPLINGVKYDYGSVEIVINGVRFGGVKSINYSHSLEPGKAYGTSAQPSGRTRGQYSAEGSMEVYKADWDDLIALLSSLGRGYMEQEFLAVVQYGEDFPVTLMTDALVGCRIKRSESSGAEGNEPLVVRADLDIMYITENLKQPLTNLKLG